MITERYPLYECARLIEDIVQGVLHVDLKYLDLILLEEVDHDREP